MEFNCSLSGNDLVIKCFVLFCFFLKHRYLCWHRLGSFCSIFFVVVVFFFQINITQNSSL